MQFQEWFEAFVRGKVEVPASESYDQLAVHSLRRFVEGSDRIWEIAATYTGRLVIRSGQIQPDGLNVTWEHWKTEHGITMPKAGS